MSQDQSTPVSLFRPFESFCIFWDLFLAFPPLRFFDVVFKIFSYKYVPSMFKFVHSKQELSFAVTESWFKTSDPLLRLFAFGVSLKALLPIRCSFFPNLFGLWNSILQWDLSNFADFQENLVQYYICIISSTWFSLILSTINIIYIVIYIYI